MIEMSRKERTMKDFQLKFITSKETVRWLRILHAFEQSTICSVKELARITKITSRTIVADITAMRRFFQEAITIETTQQGYSFREISHEAYQNKKRTLLEHEPLFQIMEGIFQDKMKNVGEWADQLHVSESSLLRYFKMIEADLARYQLNLSSKPVDLIGKEVDIRSFFHDFYYESEITPHTVFPSIAIQNIAFALQRKHFFNSYPNVSLGDFSYTLMITLERAHKNNLEIDSAMIASLKEQDAFQQFAKMNQIINQFYGKDLSTDDLLYLYVMVICRRSLTDLTGERQFVSDLQPNEEITVVAEKFLARFGQQSTDLQRDLILVRSFFTSLYLKEQLSPVTNQNIQDVHEVVQRKFPEMYVNFLRFFKVNHEGITGGKTPITEITVMSVLFMDALQEIHWGTPKNIAFLLEGNSLVCQNIQAAAIKYLGRFQHLYFPNALEMSLDYLEQYQIDLVVTNYSEYISDELIGKQYLLFKSIPDAEDWNRLLRVINPRILKEFTLQKGE
jgi:hypothetical protein